MRAGGARYGGFASQKQQEVGQLASTTAQQADTVQLEPCATCGAACPVRTDTRAYVDLIRQGRYEEAFETIRASNPFPTVCGLICHHPCEEACRRSNVDDPVALRNLKRFAAEQALEYRVSTRHKAPITHAETVGIVGSGPAGLTAAKDIIEEGYAVTVYERSSKPGGFLSCGVPKYRLPNEALQHDLDDILALGIEVKTGVSVGSDVTLAELREKHNAVVLALGLPESRGLPLENGDHPQVHGATTFLRRAALGDAPEVPDTVIVIGGGNVAVDVARTCVRLGAMTVMMVCLENEEEIPAWDWECREALEEGIEIVYRRGPTKVVVRDGDITGVVVRQVERVFDEEGRFSPTYNDDRTGTIPGEMVVLAIGQQSDLGLLEGTDVRLARPGVMAFDRDRMSTTEKGLFACGEVVTGPGAAIEAVAGGHRAARAVLGYLATGDAPIVTEEEVEEVGELPQEVIDNVRRLQRLAMPTLSPEERKKSFVQFELGYTEKDALQEALRCLSCAAGATVDEDRCAACLTCLRVCPFGVPSVDKTAVMTSDMCQACGLCAVECPAACVTIKRFFAVGDIRTRVQKLFEQSGSPVTRVEIVCAQDAEKRQDVTDSVAALNGEVIARVPVTCAALAGEVDMMKPFELGAQQVVVRTCGDCRFRGAIGRLEKRVARTRQILQAAGIDGDRLVLESSGQKRETCK